MTVTFNAEDNEFAASSGDNIDVTPNYSYFDHPPNSTANLTVTSNPGDPDPYTFEIGDTYDLSWTGHGGGTMEDAVVVRSDPLGADGHVIVFEGVNEGGDAFQMVWTPGFDLEGWYWDNGGSPSSPNAFWTEDQYSGQDAVVPCFAAGTQIAVPGGERPVETLAAGDVVVTLDDGAAPLLWSGAARVAAGGRAAPVRFATGVLGNRRPLFLSPNHRVMLASDMAEVMFGTAEVLAPAKALVDGGRIRIAPRPTITYHHLLLDRHHLLLAEGVPCESLFLGATLTGDTADQAIAMAVPGDLAHAAAPTTARPALRLHEARLLATALRLGQRRRDRAA